MKTQAIILAAGKGTRMEDLSKPKVMFELLGKPMIYYSMHHILEVGIKDKDIVLVVGYKKEQVEKYFGSSVKYAFQKEQLGTGHAVKCGLEKISEDTDVILVCCGDTPLFKPKTIKILMETFLKENPAVAMLSIIVKDPAVWAYGRVIRDKTRNVVSITEQKDCNAEELEIKECNAGFYIFKSKWLRENITKLRDNNVQKEYYLTDLVEMAVRQQQKVIALPVSEESEAFGINTKQQLREAEDVMRGREL